GSFQIGPTLPQTSAFPERLVDLDADGKPEWIRAINDGIVVDEGLGNLLTGARLGFGFNGGTLNSYDLGDLNGDGRLDAAVTLAQSGDVALLLSGPPPPPPPSHIVTATAGAGGVVVPPGDVTVAEHASRTFHVVPDVDHRIAAVVVDGVSMGPISSHTFADVTAPHTIAASFATDHVIQATSGPHGILFPAGAVAALNGANRTFTLTPAAGYRVGDVLVDGVSVGAVGSYAFTNITADHTLAAAFTTDHHIEASAAFGGSITPSGPVAVLQGQN